jgi:hypothetical protein
MANKYATLALGTRADAATWQRGCAAIGFQEGISIRNGRPTAAELKSFFADDANWIFFGGHFGGYTLMNEDFSTKIRFGTDEVTLTSPGGSDKYAQGDGFKLHASSLVVLWGGCSVCSGDSTIRNLRALFGPHVLLGFAGETGWKMVDAMLGAGFIKTDFFERLSGGKAEDVDKVPSAWMATAKAGYGGGPNESKFRTVDWDGQEWKLSGGAIVKGRRFG